ncbi:hypothetical protein CEUSTIGMA_g813.t1 [Chlamydomonas eustigma]|uniref:Uncharacterized protein n=1 Tax=Chlamydomonas eustigma TaxID=1157962 RepID=A0A250WS42_9CHLO|nr:hypothetical protein CEUSTIGMA_g813.t1 [Chlamydomonas eustigma]|eukprot:GAX73360.1 hypothetical protein CEUSTIGMA_g813.t1 [Chlamydomonas eustigma]
MDRQRSGASSREVAYDRHGDDSVEHRLLRLLPTHLKHLTRDMAGAVTLKLLPHASLLLAAPAESLPRMVSCAEKLLSGRSEEPFPQQFPLRSSSGSVLSRGGLSPNSSESRLSPSSGPGSQPSLHVPRSGSDPLPDRFTRLPTQPPPIYTTMLIPPYTPPAAPLNMALLPQAYKQDSKQRLSVDIPAGPYHVIELPSSHLSTSSSSSAYSHWSQFTSNQSSSSAKLIKRDSLGISKSSANSTPLIDLNHSWSTDAFNPGEKVAQDSDRASVLSDRPSTSMSSFTERWTTSTFNMDRSSSSFVMSERSSLLSGSTMEQGSGFADRSSQSFFSDRMSTERPILETLLEEVEAGMHLTASDFVKQCEFVDTAPGSTYPSSEPVPLGDADTSDAMGPSWSPQLGCEIGSARVLQSGLSFRHYVDEEECQQKALASVEQLQSSCQKEVYESCVPPLGAFHFDLDLSSDKADEKSYTSSKGWSRHMLVSNKRISCTGLKKVNMREKLRRWSWSAGIVYVLRTSPNSPPAPPSSLQIHAAEIQNEERLNLPEKDGGAEVHVDVFPELACRDGGLQRRGLLKLSIDIPSSSYEGSTPDIIYPVRLTSQLHADPEEADDKEGRAEDTHEEGGEEEGEEEEDVSKALSSAVLHRFSLDFYQAADAASKGSISGSSGSESRPDSRSGSLSFLDILGDSSGSDVSIGSRAACSKLLAASLSRLMLCMCTEEEVLRVAAGGRPLRLGALEAAAAAAIDRALAGLSSAAALRASLGNSYNQGSPAASAPYIRPRSLVLLNQAAPSSGTLAESGVIIEMEQSSSSSSTQRAYMVSPHDSEMSLNYILQNPSPGVGFSDRSCSGSCCTSPGRSSSGSSGSLNRSSVHVERGSFGSFIMPHSSGSVGSDSMGRRPF